MPKKKEKQIVEIHIYVHQESKLPSGGGGKVATYVSQCTCNLYKGSGTSFEACPIHPNGWHYPTTIC